MIGLLLLPLAVGMASFLSAADIAILAEKVRHLGAGESKTFGVKLHTGNPGAEGLNNVAGFSEKRNGEWLEPVAGKIKNGGAIVFTPFGAEETIKFVSLWTSIIGGTFIGWIELVEPVVVPKGGSFEIPAEAMSQLVEAV